MRELMTFFIELLISSSIFYLGYLIIKNHTTPTFKRFYLIAWLVFSVSFPLISIQSAQYPSVSINQIVIEGSNRPQPNLVLKESHSSESSPDLSVNQNAAAVGNEAKNEIDWITILKTGYLIVAGFFMVRMMIGLFQILKLKSGAKPVKENGLTIHQINNPKFKGASFFGWIFIGESVQHEREIIISHEGIHAKLWHSLDILLSHIYCCLFWINPLSWVLKRKIGLNTELEADLHILQSENRVEYAHTLLSLAHGSAGARLMNHFSTFHLKSRIVALTKTFKHKRWVSIYTVVTIVALFFLISCEHVNSPEVMKTRMDEVKTITTRFTSHQSDTQQKTGKIVAIASFSPDGNLEELVEQTTYPYDREFEVKKTFWEAPERTGIPFVMDGLSLGGAEKSFLYGHDWPSAYYKHLYAKTQSIDLPWREVVSVDNENLPEEIQVTREYNDDHFIDFGMHDITNYYEYEDEKVVRVFSKSDYPEINDLNDTQKKLREVINKNLSKEMKEVRNRVRANSGKKGLVSEYIYDGDLLMNIIWGETERKFYYEHNLLIKSEYIKSGEIINTRLHYYKNSLKDRTEIFNRYNEPEYTISYEYEFW
ncbi:M56 family metallopeptidase [Ekhidna sp.]|uniref:M56 family metallopeptidase n=1 Tax=Ekhidna sp. TaxID=2608089 RepID=UPI003296A5D8